MMIDPITPETLMEHAPYLYAHAMNRVGNHHCAEDLVQVTLVSAWESRESFKGESSLRTWLTSILKYKILDYQRSQTRKPEMLTDDMAALESSMDELFHPSGCWKINPNHGMQHMHESSDGKNEELLSWITQCIKKLPTKLATLFVARQLDMLDVKGCADTAGVTVSSVPVLMSRARHLLRLCLQKYMSK